MIARPMLASVFVVGGVSALRNAPKLESKAAAVAERLLPLVKRVAPTVPVPEDPVTLVRVNAAVRVTAGAALATGRAPRLSAAVLAATLVPSTVAGHRFWAETEPSRKEQDRRQFFTNVSLLGGLVIASVDTDGKPGLAWRARRAARDARRETRHLARSARREARLAAARVS
jgi:uncharacterized membrane protein YphA (DoxX/SURF4 family)